MNDRHAIRRWYESTAHWFAMAVVYHNPDPWVDACMNDYVKKVYHRKKIALDWIEWSAKQEGIEL